MLLAYMESEAEANGKKNLINILKIAEEMILDILNINMDGF